MTFDQFPLPGYLATRTRDESLRGEGGSAFVRDFNVETSIKSGGYGGHQFYIAVLSPDKSAKSWVAQIQCADNTAANAVASEVPIRSLGDVAKACRMVSDNFLFLFLYTGTRNVGIIAQTTIVLSVPHPTDAEALETLAQLAEWHLALIDQVAPPGPAMTVASGTPRFQFTAPATLPPADAGKPYLPGGQPFSFCDPPTVNFTMPCPPPGSSQRNPTGGSPPYHFQYGTMGGFPPFGMALGKDGQLTGTPHVATTGKTYRFTVCAVDIKGDFVCRDVLLTVTAPPKPDLTVLPVTFSPSTAKPGDTIAVTFTVKNQGAAPSGTFSNRIFLAYIKGDTDISLGNFNMGGLAAGASQSSTVNATIPATVPPDSYLVTVFADALQAVSESDENNNVGSSGPSRITVTAPPPPATLDATIQSASCTGTFIQNFNSGNSQYRFTVTASGTASGPVYTNFGVSMSTQYVRVISSSTVTSSWLQSYYGGYGRGPNDPSSATWNSQMVWTGSIYPNETEKVTVRLWYRERNYSETRVERVLTCSR